MKSNAESAAGYMDILLEIPSTKVGCVIEVKYAENGRYDQSCAQAMKQIAEGEYTQPLKQDGMHTIHQYGIACYKKSCKIVYQMEKYSPR